MVSLSLMGLEIFVGYSFNHHQNGQYAQSLGAFLLSGENCIVQFRHDAIAVRSNTE